MEAVRFYGRIPRCATDGERNSIHAALGGHLGVTAAFQRAPASVVAPFEYTALAWATIFGFLFFGDFPGPMVWMGVAVIVGAGLYTLRGEDATP